MAKQESCVEEERITRTTAADAHHRAAPGLIAFDGRMRRRRSQMTGIDRGNDLIQSMHAGDDIMTAAGYLRSLAAVLPFEPDPPQGELQKLSSTLALPR